MSATTVTMTREEAAAFRKAYGAHVKRLSRMGKVALAIEERRLMREQGIVRAFGGPASKDEFISSVLELRGYTITKWNESTHAVAHDVPWPDCPWCAEVAQ